MASSVYLLYKVNIANLVRDKVIIVKEFYIQPSEIDRMPFWEYEMVREEISRIMKDRNEQEEQQRADYDPSKYRMKQPKYDMPKPNFSMPKTNFKL